MLLRAGAQVIATTRFPHDAAAPLRVASPTSPTGRTASRSTASTCGTRRASRSSAACIDRDARAGSTSSSTTPPDGAPAARLLRAPARARGALRRGAARRAQAARGSPPRVRAAARRGRRRPAPRAQPAAGASLEDADGLVAWRGGGAGLGLRHSAALSQVGFGFDESRAPRGPLPRRRASTPTSSRSTFATLNSWRLTLAEVATPEMLEVQLVNAVAPVHPVRQAQAADAARAASATSTSSTSRRWRAVSRAARRPTSTRTRTWRRPRST